MTHEEMNRLNLTPIGNCITEDFGAIGTPSRNKFEVGVYAFILGEKLKEERRKVDLHRNILLK